MMLANAAAEALADAPDAAFHVSLAWVPAGLVAGRRIVMAPALTEEARGLGALVRATALGGPGGALRLSDAAGMPALAALVAPLPGRFGGT
ncbi:MAG: hypothetical protein K2X49_29040, partial [Acetobacteraceae bacterium]|nr:hypothetical protein [Acetobacteraceae bacterium]